MESLAENPSTRNTFEPPPLSELLERAGFRVRGRRADCIHCNGHSRLTLAFNENVYFCHRCKRAGNARTLARELGMQLAPETQEQRARRRRAAEFNVWLNTCHTILIRRLSRLTSRAELAKTVLRGYPECEPAWNALADLYHNKAILLTALDTLSFEKLSPWLESPMTRPRLLAAFEDAFQRVELGMSDAA